MQELLLVQSVQEDTKVMLLTKIDWNEIEELSLQLVQALVQHELPVTEVEKELLPVQHVHLELGAQQTIGIVLIVQPIHSLWVLQTHALHV